MAHTSLLIVGAGGPLGRRLLDLAVADTSVGSITATWHRTRPDRQICDRVAIKQLNLDDTGAAANLIAAHDTAILTPILTVTAPALIAARKAGASTSCVVFSSNNVVIDPENPVYEGLKNAERSLRGLPFSTATLRPTMIYGDPQDGNLSRLLRLAARFPFLPLPGPGDALQQPVHYDDLARIALEITTGSHLDASNRPVSVAGPEAVTLRALLAAAQRSVGRTPRLVSVPLGPVRALAGLLPLPVKPAQLDRLHRHKVPAATFPPAILGRIHLEDGLSRLARELDLVRRSS